MKKYIPYIITLAAITGFLAIAPNTTRAQTTDSLLTDSVDQSEFPQITAQPVDQTVLIGANVVLSVQANNADGYQWLINGVPADGQTNSSLIIANAGIGDVGLYSCEVFNGGEMVPTRTASVEVETTAGATVASTTAAKAMTTSALIASAMTSSMMAAGMPAGGPIIVLGTPLLGSGSQGSCPGPYAGYVNYAKTVSQGWGWAPISGVKVLTAVDGSGRTDTKIQYFGAYGDGGCAQTAVTIPYPPFSPVYRFTIYFTNNVPTSTNYPIVLTGFNP
ncbi:MAG: immunoglobulin domain-containing protein [Verrucomicrobiota bacterium]|jgi:hypothetical protein